MHTFCKSDSRDRGWQRVLLAEDDEEAFMNDKKSMRIFWLTMCLALVFGTMMVVTAQFRSHQSLTEDSYENKETDPSAVRAAAPDTDETVPQDAAASFAIQPHPQNNSSAENSRGPAVSQNPVEFRFELKVKNGYLDVYHFHTENLFFHTGIPYHAMSQRQRQELENGKYFVNEQELYGYLESCTS